MKIRFRPHHFLCALGFEGKGYNLPFIENFEKIASILRSDDGNLTKIEITSMADSICTPCPNRIGATCKTEDKILKLDQEHHSALNLSGIHTLTWGEAKNRIKEKISLEVFHQICEPCEWRSLGVCENALKKLKSETGSRK